jgi:hypothetical protein
MAKFKQTQIRPGVTKHRSNATKVYVGTGGCAANDILVATGMQGDFLSVVAADNTDITKCRGPFFVADYAAAAGEYTAVALPMKTITGVDTDAATGVGDAVYLSTGGDVIVGALPAAVTATTEQAFGTLDIRVGRVTKKHATEGAYVLEPGVANGAPLVGRVTRGGTGATMVLTGFTAELEDAPVVCTNSKGSSQYVLGANIASNGKLTITASANTTDTFTYAIFA